MASSLIHMCIAKEINKELNRNNDLIMLGSIAPDISKTLGENKIKSHFQDRDDNIPNIDAFSKKYHKHLKNDFVLGYYIHLYTDYLWFKYFKPNFMINGKIYLLDGTVAKVEKNDYQKYFYNDYTNLNIILSKEYDLDLSFLENKIPKMKDVIEEIPMNQIQRIVDKTLIIIKKSHEKKSYVIDKDIIKKFITSSVYIILSKLEEIGYKKN